MSGSWSRQEVELIVQDYFSMLEAELLSQPYNKAEHRRLLKELLNGRTEGSIERKHQNISAVMLELGMPYINGYKPLSNFQNLLMVTVSEHISIHPQIEKKLDIVVTSDVIVPSVEDILDLMEAPPEPILRTQMPYAGSRMVNPNKTNYLKKEAQNQKLGIAGELFVVNYEKARLMYEGKPDLAEKIEHTAVTQGDGAGFDIRSYNEDGSDRFIETKTTRFGKYTPFFASRNEVEFSMRNKENYWLYRAFEFQEDPRLFNVRGSLEEKFKLTPFQFIASY